MIGSTSAALPPGCVKAPIQPFAVTGVAQSPNMASQVKAGYYKKECLEGSRFASQYSKKTIKKAWGF
jgi:hypothetical protein